MNILDRSGGRIIIRVFLITILFLVLGYALIAADAESLPEDVAIDGYDPVAYFTLNSATTGSNQYHFKWKNKTWLFSSSRHRKLFADNPDRYAPQFDGFCANGLSDGHAIAADPENWRVIDGKLYLYFTNHGREQWTGKVDMLIKDASNTYGRFSKNKN